LRLFAELNVPSELKSTVVSQVLNVNFNMNMNVCIMLQVSLTT
jgi:hypothetical protein